MAKIDAQAQIAKHGANLRELLKELSKATRDQNKTHIRGKIQQETFALCNLITDGLEQGALVGDPTGCVMGKTVFGEEVDAAAQAWFQMDVARSVEANQKLVAANPKAETKEPRAIVARKALAAASANGVDTGPWKRVTMFFVNGIKVVLEKGKNALVWMYKGMTFVVKWVWDKIVGLWSFVVAKSKAFGAWIASFFKRNPKPAVTTSADDKVIEVSDTDLTQLESLAPAQPA